MWEGFQDFFSSVSRPDPGREHSEQARGREQPGSWFPTENAHRPTHWVAARAGKRSLESPLQRSWTLGAVAWQPGLAVASQRSRLDGLPLGHWATGLFEGALPPQGREKARPTTRGCGCWVLQANQPPSESDSRTRLHLDGTRNLRLCARTSPLQFHLDSLHVTLTLQRQIDSTQREEKETSTRPSRRRHRLTGETASLCRPQAAVPSVPLPRPLTTHLLCFPCDPGPARPYSRALL